LAISRLLYRTVYWSLCMPGILFYFVINRTNGNQIFYFENKCYRDIKSSQFIHWWCCLMYRVGIELPTVEVRYQNLKVDAQCYVGNRALPTLWNATRNILEVRGLILFIFIAYTKFGRCYFPVHSYVEWDFMYISE